MTIPGSVISIGPERLLLRQVEDAPAQGAVARTGGPADVFAGLLTEEGTRGLKEEKSRTETERPAQQDIGAATDALPGIAASLSSAQATPASAVDDVHDPAPAIARRPKDSGPGNPDRPDRGPSDGPGVSLRKVSVRNSAVWLRPTISPRVSEHAAASVEGIDNSRSVESKRDHRSGEEEKSPARGSAGSALGGPVPPSTQSGQSGSFVGNVSGSTQAGVEAAPASTRFMSDVFEGADHLHGMTPVPIPTEATAQREVPSVVKSLDVTFEPDDLGRIDMRMRLSIEGLEIHMTAADIATDQVLRSERESLVEILSGVGYAVNGMDISSPRHEQADADGLSAPVGTSRDDEPHDEDEIVRQVPRRRRLSI